MILVELAAHFLPSMRILMMLLQEPYIHAGLREMAFPIFSDKTKKLRQISFYNDIDKRPVSTQ